MPNNSDPNKKDQKTTAPNATAASGDKNNNPNTAAPALSKPASENSPVENVKETAKNVLDQAKDSAGQAYGLVAEKATSTIKEQKSNLSSGLAGVADSIRQVGENLRTSPDEKNPVTDLTAKYGDTIADQIERVSTYFDKKDFQEIVRDVEVFARRQPALFIGAAFAAGLLATRFLKSSGSGHAVSHSKAGASANHPAAPDNHSADKPAGQSTGGAS